MDLPGTSSLSREVSGALHSHAQTTLRFLFSSIDWSSTYQQLLSRQFHSVGEEPVVQMQPPLAGLTVADHSFITSCRSALIGSSYHCAYMPAMHSCRNVTENSILAYLHAWHLSVCSCWQLTLTVNSSFPYTAVLLVESRGVTLLSCAVR